MKKTSFIKRVSQKNQKQQITQRVYNHVLKELLTGIQQELAAGRKVQFHGFGTFYTRIRKASKGRHFKTNKVINVPAIRLATFRAGSLLKKAVRRKK
jgi:DNA-binding protein HU-beta